MYGALKIKCAKSNVNVSIANNRRFFSNLYGDGADGTKKPIGFIGLGNMGGHMARNLAKSGHPLVIHDINSENIKGVKSAYENIVKVASSPKEVASEVEYLVTMLPSSPHVQAVYSGENGVFSSVKSKSLLIDASTIDPNTARQVASKARELQCDMLDAPVSGGVLGAEKGTLTFMVGGDQQAFERAKSILNLMGKNVVHCGDCGNGQVVKLCNNLALAISMIGTSEAMNLGIKMGMDPKLLASIFNTSTSRCWSSDSYNPVPGVMEGVPSSREYSGGFGVDLMAKDLGLAISAANQIKAPLPLGGQALQVYNFISTHGLGNKDFSVVYQYLQKDKKF